nr:reverse transcriptase domain-containing protein [Tanacetum cinerariifolium]
MAESAKRHDEKSNLIKENQASMNDAIRNQGALIKDLEIQIGKIRKVLQEREFGSLPGSNKTNSKDHVKSISTTIEAEASLIRRIDKEVLGELIDRKESATNLKRLLKERPRMGYQIEASMNVQESTLLKDSLPTKEKDLGSFTIPCYINNICFEKALADLGASVNVMPYYQSRSRAATIAVIRATGQRWSPTVNGGKPLVNHRWPASDHRIPADGPPPVNSGRLPVNGRVGSGRVNDRVRMNTNSRENASKTDDRIDKLVDQILTLVDIFAKKVVTPAPIKAVEESCVNCGGPHAHYNCDAINSNQPSVCVATGPGNNFHGNLAFQVPNQGFQNQPFQVPNNQVQQGDPNEFLSYKKANDQMMRNMQSQINSLKGEFKNEIQNTIKTQQTVLMEQQNAFQNNLQNMLSGFFQNQALTSGTLLSNTIPNPKGEIKTITIRSGVAYEGSSIPTPKKTLPKPNIPYPSRLNDQKFREKATNQIEKFFQIFQDLHLDIIFADALILMPKFASTIKSLLTNKDKLFELAKIPLNENCLAMLLKKLLEKIGDLDKFLIPWRSFLRTGRGLIDVYGEEITLRVNDKAVTFNLNQTTRYYSTYDDFSVNRIDIIDVAREEYDQEILGFSKNSLGGNPTSTSEPILSDSSPSLTPFEGNILLIEKLLNNDSFQLPSMDLKQGEVVKAKSSIEEPPKLELKDLPSHLEYAYLEGEDKLPVIIAKDLKDNEKEALLKVLISHKKAIAWKITNIMGIDPWFCTHKILMEEDYKPVVQSQRRVNLKIHEVIKKEVIKLLNVEMIYLISDSPWVSPIHCVPKKGGITVVENKNNELISTWLVTGWRVCIDYKLNDAIGKDHFPLPFMDQMLERLAGNEFYCFLDGFSGYFQIRINPPDQEKTTFTCPYGTFAYRRMPFGLCNAPGTFQRCMMAIFHDMIKKTMEVFMDDFLGIVLGHKISKNGLEVDRAKVDVIVKLPHPTTLKVVRSFLRHASFYRRFIQDFSKIAKPMTHLLEKETPFVFSKDCINAFETLGKKLTESSIFVVPDWNLPFELMCDASDFAIGAVLGQQKTKHFQPIHYAIRQ